MDKMDKMEKEALIAAMKNSISEVLEKMFFLPLDFVDTISKGALWEDLKASEIITSRLNFSGPISGYFLLYIPAGLAHSLAASFMGIDEESISHDHVTDTVKEIINMIAGNTFGIFDDQTVFDLGIPELINVDDLKDGDSKSEEDIFIAINTLENRLGLRMVNA